MGLADIHFESAWTSAESTLGKFGPLGGGIVFSVGLGLCYHLLVIDTNSINIWDTFLDKKNLIEKCSFLE